MQQVRVVSDTEYGFYTLGNNFVNLFESTNDSYQLDLTIIAIQLVTLFLYYCLLPFVEKIEFKGFELYYFIALIIEIMIFISLVIKLLITNSTVTAKSMIYVLFLILNNI